VQLAHLPYFKGAKLACQEQFDLFNLLFYNRWSLPGSIKINMKRLTITQAKPNPSGKDRLGSLVPYSQLAGEWVDFENTGDENYPLTNIRLYHIAYTTQYPDGVWEEAMSFTGALGAGKVVRVHSGGKVPLESLALVDRVGANYHLFTGDNYIWNNDKGDSPRLVLKQGGQLYEVDRAFYSAYPPEGKILKRVGGQLI
jgi:hypothetical protein